MSLTADRYGRPRKTRSSSTIPDPDKDQVKVAARLICRALQRGSGVIYYRSRLEAATDLLKMIDRRQRLDLGSGFRARRETVLAALRQLEDNKVIHFDDERLILGYCGSIKPPRPRRQKYPRQGQRTA